MLFIISHSFLLYVFLLVYSVTQSDLLHENLLYSFCMLFQSHYYREVYNNNNYILHGSVFILVSQRISSPSCAAIIVKDIFTNCSSVGFMFGLNMK